MIETVRLILREYTLDDFYDLYEIVSDQETMENYPAPFDEVKTIKPNFIIEKFEELLELDF